MSSPLVCRTLVELVNLLTNVESSKRNPKLSTHLRANVQWHGEGVFLREPNMTTSMSIISHVLRLKVVGASCKVSNLKIA